MLSNDLDYDKIIEWHQEENIYLIHLLIDQQQLSIEVQDKLTGEIWHSVYHYSTLQELTEKAKYPKKYPVFIKMLLSAFQKTNDSLKVDILSHKQLTMRINKALAQKSMSAEQLSKKYLILSYVNEFDKMQYPLSLKYNADSSPERLRMTIRRLSQELQLLSENKTESETVKQLLLAKHENDLLKAKIKHFERNKLEAKQNQNISLSRLGKDEHQIEEFRKQIQEKNNLIENLKQNLMQTQKRLGEKQTKINQVNEQLKIREQAIKKYEHQIKKKGQKNKDDKIVEEKIQSMMKSMTKLSQELQHARQKEKKSEIKIISLQKQLEMMIAAKRSKRSSSPESSKKFQERQLSVKSGKSNQSKKSQKSQNKIGKQTLYSKKTNALINKLKGTQKKSSVYDSDTESSRMRKQITGRNSPFRQSNQRKTPTKGNLVERQRSKSKEKEVNRLQHSTSNAMMTDGSEDSDDQQYQKINSVLNNIKKSKITRQKENEREQKSSKINAKINDLQQMIRRTAESTRRQ